MSPSDWQIAFDLWWGSSSNDRGIEQRPPIKTLFKKILLKFFMLKQCTQSTNIFYSYVVVHYIF